MTDFYNTCQLDLINIEPERRIELIPVDHKRKQKRQTRYKAQSLFLKTGVCTIGFFIGIFLYYIAAGY